MRKPIVAIVGRPNVGKSTLFNRIVGKRLAVVEDIPGLTRDRLYGEAEWKDKTFLVVDTGGFQLISGEDIVREVKKQAVAAIEEADVVVMLMDGNTGLAPSDIELSNILRKYDKKVFYVVNKIDGPKKERALYEFYSLGVDLFPVSALSGYGFDELMDSIATVISVKTGEDIEEYPRIAIVGRPNVGKSTLVNSLLGKERMVVSPIPGTTRDAVDSICAYYRKKYIIVDTAGIRKKGKMAKSYERYSFIRTLKNIESCDVALIILDAGDGVVEMDQKIASLVHDAGKAAIILFNKWDLTVRSPQLLKKLRQELQRKLWFMHYSPVLTISALNRQRVTKIFPLVDEVIAESSKRITTHELNNFLRYSLSIQRPPLYKGKEVKLYYIAQIRIKPPCFVIFTNKSEGIKSEYIRFLEKQLRERFLFKGVPVRFYIRQKT
jgi:GTP-binding protein